MVVQHNITAMNANRMLGLTTGSLAKSTEKLSSGYRINRAADDAAGLSISEKMRKQIRGLSQASTNAEDGISAVQTAEGALTEVHSMLQRMNELAVQASNGTLTDETDRKAVQDEIDQLITEVDRVSETTKFNDLYLLKGAQGDQEVSVSYVTALKETPGLKSGKTAPTTWYAKGGTTALSAQEILDSLDIDADGNVVLKEGKELYKVAATPNTENGAQVKQEIVSDADIQNLYEKASNGLRKDAANGDFATEEELKNYFNEDGTYKGGLFGKKTADGTYVEVGAEYIDKFVSVKKQPSDVALQFSLHVGAESDPNNKITVKIESMSAKGIGIDGLKTDGLMTQGDATNAIDTIGNAIQKVSNQRSALGAVQNRLEHTIANLDNVVENTTSAESRIRDTDMAEEMVAYSKNSILQQAGQSMLAQANQANQGVLSLLQ